MLDLSLSEIALLIVGAAGIGVSKSGFAGVSMVHVLVFAFVFGARDSTGVLLPLLVIGDLMAIRFYGKSVQWQQVRNLLPASMLGVLLGCMLMGQMNETTFKPTVGTIILSLTLIQIVRIWRPAWFEHIPHQKWFAWSLGFLAGVTTMMANAAGPIVALYLLALSLPKLELVACSAWFFLVINVFKLPFSAFLGLISIKSLVMDVLLAPGILLGMYSGKWMIERIPQKTFDSLLLAFTFLAALRLVGLTDWLWASMGTITSW